jgi:CPA2 family monovalent cation:H+ antiporter-2
MRKQYGLSVHGKLLLELTLVQIIFVTIIITSIILLSANYILPLVADSKFGNAIAALTTIVVISPLALSLRRVAAEQVDALYKEKIQRAYIYDDLFRMG